MYSQRPSFPLTLFLALLGGQRVDGAGDDHGEGQDQLFLAPGHGGGAGGGAGGKKVERRSTAGPSCQAERPSLPIS